MQKRPCEIYEIKLLDYKYPTASFKALVSSGTYIRSIANDL
jgi:tRNA U55 pseudouridine synthase TruB